MQVDLETWLYHLAEQHVIHPGAKDPQFHTVYRSFLTDNANVVPPSLAHVRAGVGGGGAAAKQRSGERVKVLFVYDLPLVENIEFSLMGPECL